MEKNWKIKIETMDKIMMELRKVNIDILNEYNCHEIPATEKQIGEVEELLGYKLDQEYKSFLRSSNGWRGLMLTIDLFGTTELMKIEDIDSVNILLDSLGEEGVLESVGFSKRELLPIAVAKHDIDLFLMTNANSNTPGIIIWFAGYEIERYESFGQFFSAMLEYNRERVEIFKVDMI